MSESCDNCGGYGTLPGGCGTVTPCPKCHPEEYGKPAEAPELVSDRHRELARELNLYGVNRVEIEPSAKIISKHESAEIARLKETIATFQKGNLTRSMISLTEITAAFESASEEERLYFQLWVDNVMPRTLNQATRDELLRRRVLEFPVTTESLEIAKSLRLEGFYNAGTKLCDIARRVEKIRTSPHRR